SADDRTALEAELTQWKAKYETIAQAQGLLPAGSTNRTIDDDTDLLQRLLANKHAVDVARKNNPKAQFSTDHKFALMTELEFKKFVSVSFQQGNHTARTLAAEDTAAAQASSVDWTTGSCVPPVRDQGQCGSCWAFSATGVSEMAHCIVTGQLYVLSEQQVTSCDTANGNGGCNGGFPWYAIDYVATNGLCLDSDWPYSSGTSGQTGSCSKSCTKKQLSIGQSVQVSGESALATALNKQPVSVTVEAGNSVWQNYQGGVVTRCPGAQSDHAVIAVGYDGQSYKVRNSWGAGWGEGGYIRLQQGVGDVGTCNVVNSVSYPQINVNPTPTPTSKNPSPSTPSPPTPKPSTTKPTPKPSTPVPQPGCGNCHGCYYPAGNQCLIGWTPSDCQLYNLYYGTVWCN
ncbi:hypothetical protein As57867_001596, partial [Aphanomyces stellatus]